MTSPNDVATLVERLRFIATARAESNQLAGRTGKEWRKETEIEWVAATTIAALQAEVERAQRSLQYVQNGDGVASYCAGLDAGRTEASKSLSESARDAAMDAAYRFVFPKLSDIQKEKGAAGVWVDAFRTAWDAASRSASRKENTP